MSDLTREEMRDRLGNLDKIRDILVGSQMRDYENRFSQIESELSLLHQDISDRIDTVKNALRLEIQSSTEQIEKHLKSLTANTQEELAERRQQVERLDQKFTTHINALDESLDQKTNTLRHQFSENRDKLQTDLRSLRTQIFEELDSRFGMLREDKLAKEDMAAILFELGMRLRGDEFVPALRAALDTEVSAEIMSE
ncbi:MAG: hypothetical protein SW833_18085 [Cyanobacteriota bacterium]|nr:hypothetical protein [Cyanobacteriota bacterium]